MGPNRNSGNSRLDSKRNSKSFHENIILVLIFIAVFIIGASFFIPSVTSSEKFKELASRQAKEKAEKVAEAKMAEEKKVANEEGEGNVLGTSTSSEDVTSPQTITHVLTPKSVKAVYISSWVGGTPSLRSKIIAQIERNEINAVVLDIKDYTGMISFKPNSPTLVSMGCIDERIRDIGPFIKELHDKNIYVIGRVAVFQDPCLVKKKPESAVKRKSDGGIWKDKKGITWMDAGAQDVWDYNIEIARASHAMGFDEINFDYIRYPTDGNMKDIAFPVSGTRSKSASLEAFFKYIDKQLREGRASSTSDPIFDELALARGFAISTTSASKADTSLDGTRVETTLEDMPRIILSADLFGLVTNNTDDMGIGQVLTKAAPYVDFIMPMVYPSHYPATFIGYKNPAAHPYEIVKHAMSGGVAQMKKQNLNPLKLRPWLQDFNLGATYTADMVRKQIRATYDTGLTSWTLWDASNTYTVDGALNI